MQGLRICVDACPPKCLFLIPELNAYGVHPARYSGGVYRLRYLLLCVPGAGGDYGVPAESTEGGQTEDGGKPCGNSVRETSQS